MTDDNGHKLDAIHQEVSDTLIQVAKLEERVEERTDTLRDDTKNLFSQINEVRRDVAAQTQRIMSIEEFVGAIKGYIGKAIMAIVALTVLSGIGQWGFKELMNLIMK